MKMYAVVVLTLVVSACKLDRTLPLCVSTVSAYLCVISVCLILLLSACACLSPCLCCCLSPSHCLSLSVSFPVSVAVRMSATLPVSVVCHHPCLFCLPRSLSLLSATFPVIVVCNFPCLSCPLPSLSLLSVTFPVSAVCHLPTFPVSVAACLCCSLRVSVSLSLLLSAALPASVGPSCPPKHQTVLYDILPSTTAVCSYAIGPRKLSANEQLFCLCSNSSKFVTNSSNYIRRLFYVANIIVAYASSNKTKIA